MVSDILEQQQQNMLTAQKNDQEMKQQQCTFGKELKKKTKTKGGTCSSEHDTAKKGTDKGNPSRCPVKRDNFPERQHARETGRRPFEKEERPPCSSNNR